MWQRIVMFLSVMVLSQLQLFAQPTPTYRAVFSSDGPFYTSCEGQTPLPLYSHVVILWDADHNGPGGYDALPATEIGFPESVFGNIYDFYTDLNGAFDSPIFEGNYYLGTPEPFYLIVEHEDSFVTRWTSQIATLMPIHSNSDPPQFVSLQASLWSCDTVSEAIQCETDPPYVVVPMHLGLPDRFCVRTCQGGLTDLYLWHINDSLDATTVPVITIEGGCGDSLPAEFEFDQLKWSFIFDSWECTIVGHELGWYNVTFHEEAPAGVIDNFDAQRIGETVSLNWTTSGETDIDHFELWSYHSDYRYWLRRLGDIDGAGVPAEYSFIDQDPQPATGYIWYCLLMVTSDSTRWPARRAYVPRPLSATGQTSIPGSICLIGNYPNPFNATTQIGFELPVTSAVTLNIFDINGRQVTTLVDEIVMAGVHTISFDGSSFASGIYFARLTAGSYSTTHKMVLLK